MIPSPEFMFRFDCIALVAMVAGLLYDIHYYPHEGPIKRMWRKWAH